MHVSDANLQMKITLSEIIVFRGIQKMPELQANQNFLLQLCAATELALANTYFEHGADQLVTYYEIGATPMESIQDNKFAQLDFILCEALALADMAYIKSIRELAFASHHFILLCENRLK